MDEADACHYGRRLDRLQHELDRHIRFSASANVSRDHQLECPLLNPAEPRRRSCAFPRELHPSNVRDGGAHS
jgi:hypothetical protein